MTPRRNLRLRQKIYKSRASNSARKEGRAQKQMQTNPYIDRDTSKKTQKPAERAPNSQSWNNMSNEIK